MKTKTKPDSVFLGTYLNAEQNRDFAVLAAQRGTTKRALLRELTLDLLAAVKVTETKTTASKPRGGNMRKGALV